MRAIEKLFVDYLDNSLSLNLFCDVFIKDYLFYIRSDDGGIMFNQLDKRPIIPAFLLESYCNHYTKYKYKSWKMYGSLFIDIAPYGYDLLIYGEQGKSMLMHHKFFDEIVSTNLGA